jgi:AhpD family alkylhydroperoxidase
VRLTYRHASAINRELIAGVAVSETGRCPYCGSAASAAGANAAPEPDGPARAGLEPLYREVRRIREIAEAHAVDDDTRRITEAHAADDDARRIAELTRQVHELRATVARLRGPGVAAAVYTRSGTSTSSARPAR